MIQFAPFEWPRWALMWTLAVEIYLDCKWLTWQRARVRHVPAWKHAAYLLAWPGLDAASFLEGGPISNCSHCRFIEWLAALGKLTFGAALLFAVPRMVPSQHAYIVGWIGMIGLVLILHFGIFHLLSCSWRSIGVQAQPLMNRPLASTSLSEFWGRRWNTAFRDLMHRFLFRPCASWFGPRWGILAGFLFSGAIHDLVISVPARGGMAVRQFSLRFRERRWCSSAVRLGTGSDWVQAGQDDCSPPPSYSRQRACCSTVRS